MKAEDIIMLVFVALVVTGIPLLLWAIERDKKKQEQEEREKWNRLNREKLNRR